MPELTIIVPVYNVEKYLCKCIDSILSQTYTDFELILIDDGSTDLSGEICDQYKEKDKRIIVIHKTNQGLSSARNAGINIASGKFIGFVDSDDWIETDFYEQLILNSINYDADIVASQVYVVKGNSEKVLLNSHDRAYSKIETMDLYLRDPHYFTIAVWNKLYRRKLFTNIRFPEHKLFEDFFINHKLFMKTNKLVFINSTSYYYLIRSEGIMGNTRKKISLDIYDAIDCRASFVKQYYPQYQLNIFDTHYDMLMSFMITILDTDLDLKMEINREYMRRFAKFIRNNCRYMVLSRKIGITKKVCLLFCVIDYHPYYLIKKILKLMRKNIQGKN